MAKTAPVDPGTFVPFDDAERIGNGGAPDGEQVLKIIHSLNVIAGAGRNIRSFWGGSTDRNVTRLRRSIWPHALVAGHEIRGEILYLKDNSNADTNGQGLVVTVDDGDVSTAVTFPLRHDLRESAAQSYPEDADRFDFGVGDETPQLVKEVALGSATANGPMIVSGCLWEPARVAVDPAVTRAFLDGSHVAPGREILGAGVGSSNADLDAVRDFFLHVWNRKRPVIGADELNPGTGYIEFATSSQEYRYIYDQTIGDGGTAPADDGPGATFPLYKCASGRRTTIPVVVMVYAAMSGNTDDGTIDVFHRDGAGGMVDQLPGITVSGTTFAWYPAFDAAQPWPTFDARTDILKERILLAGRSEGATDKLRIGAWYMFPLFDDSLP